MKDSKKKKLKSSGKSTRDKMLERKHKLENKGSGGGFVFPKDGTTRLRILSPGPDEELGIEIITFFMGTDKGSVISPATFDEPCPFWEKYQELKNSDDDSDKELAKKLIPKRKFVIGGIGYKDEKGKEIDPDRVKRGFQIPSGVYSDIVELYLDEDEWGDMTDELEGYDIKIQRSGKGLKDTKYSVTPCSKKPLDKKYRGESMDLEKLVRSSIKSYDELESILDDYLGSSFEGDDYDEKPKKKKKKSTDTKSKKKKSK